MKRNCDSRSSRFVLAGGAAAWLAASILAAPELTLAQGYDVARLVSDVSGAAAHTDTNLVNAWGLAIGRRGTLIVASTETSQTRFYQPDGTVNDFSIVVDEDPTGLLINEFPFTFRISDHGITRPSQLLFVSEEGKIMGWNFDVNATEAAVAVDNSGKEAVYKGLAQAWSRRGPRLYATDFHDGSVEVYDQRFQWVGSFTDPGVDAGFAPFNVANIAGLLYVTFAKQELPAAEDDEPGPGNGFVDVFTPEGHLLRRLVAHGPLNSPWGLAFAPRDFGQFGGALLVGNFGDGKINAFTPWTGRFLGELTDGAGNPISIDGLWALRFRRSSMSSGNHGNSRASVLYFTSGPEGESHGLVGSIVPAHKTHSR